MSPRLSWRAWVLAACAALAGCRKESPEGGFPPGSSWEVLKNGQPVLLLKNEPGPLTSTAAPPPGQEPPRHPFLTASALDPIEENALRETLDKSRSFEEFVSLLKAQGYTLRPAAGP